MRAYRTPVSNFSRSESVLHTDKRFRAQQGDSIKHNFSMDWPERGSRDFEMLYCIEKVLSALDKAIVTGRCIIVIYENRNSDLDDLEVNNSISQSQPKVFFNAEIDGTKKYSPPFIVTDF